MEQQTQEMIIHYADKVRVLYDALVVRFNEKKAHELTLAALQGGVF